VLSALALLCRHLSTLHHQLVLLLLLLLIRGTKAIAAMQMAEGSS